ncbi:monovalent cation:proton antiporter-2 (CPA2) family protein [Amphritea sp. 2_MG-2023]|uniref:monovalent cation:proton antiporter-2 (CPA2) family protein n=1 Tax=Amphritea TaxID=515417 RepID=UPI001C07760D|nr:MULTISPECIES: monovalent cation:proton antiporter-2 (CPA2) family protein [Amphritea]MBU2964301.1 monovalent cation:proton antiporter-2 (CPA2) family protein [Amphritea atlantica]MDO6419441.1 monovalent cation:proton antiporter-2 (CPA2) family protein [Amphritea sp. 2_MG-2023]
MTTYFIQAAIYLLVAVICVPLAKRLGLGSVLGYLIAGVIIGPITGLVGNETTTIQHFAEFGVVMMLFIVGLELSPKALWNMKNRLISLGGLQLSLTTLIITLLGMALEFPWQPSLVVGLIFSLSSTAIVMQTFAEKSLNKTDGGRAAFSILLSQDIAVIPMLAVIPLLAIPTYFGMPEIASSASEHDNISLVEQLSGWQYAGVIAFAITLIIVVGHYVSKPLFTWVANTGLREIYTATALLLVIAIAALMSLVGLSPALGTFLAGVVLANSEFRHELESNIQPFKGLLLGLFFITVGAGISFSVIAENFWLISSLTLAVIIIKALVLLSLAIIFRIRKSDGWLLTLSLAQAGEFGFVVLSVSSQSQALPGEWIAILSPVITLSMFLTPLLFILYDKVITPKYLVSQQPKEADSIDKKGQVIIAGIGRFGQVINRLLTVNGFETTVIDQSITVIDRVKKIGMHAYFGDATDPALLNTAGLDEASLFIIAINDKERVLPLIKHVKQFHPNLPIVTRAYDRGQAYALEEAGADHVFIESYFTALEMSKTSLQVLGFSQSNAEKAKSVYYQTEQQHHKDLLKASIDANKESHLVNNYIELFISLEKEMQAAMKEQLQDK